jgi:subtilisin
MASTDQPEEGETKQLPAWSSQFSAESLREIEALGPIGDIDREWAWGGSTGKGIQVAVIDSGIEHDHPAGGTSVRGGTVVEVKDQASGHVRFVDDNPPGDIFGHGTACAGIIHAIAPEAELYSVRVIGRDLSGKALQFAGGIRWAIDQGMSIANMSLSTSRQEYYGLFHELADAAYFNNVLLVSAVNNIPAPSYPSLYSSVVSVAAHEGHDPFTYYYNPAPPVEFGAPGIDVEVAWLNKSTSVSTGNSFAAPHITGIIALIRAKHPDLTPFQVKTILLACAANATHG